MYDEYNTATGPPQSATRMIPAKDAIGRFSANAAALKATKIYPSPPPAARHPPVCSELFAEDEGDPEHPAPGAPNPPALVVVVRLPRLPILLPAAHDRRHLRPAAPAAAR